MDTYYFDIPSKTIVETSNIKLDQHSQTRLAVSASQTTFHIYSLEKGCRRIAVIQLGFIVERKDILGNFIFFGTKNNKKAQIVNLNTFETTFAKKYSYRLILPHYFAEIHDIEMLNIFHRPLFIGWEENRKLVVGKFSDKRVYRTSLPYSRVSDMFDDRLVSYYKNNLTIYDIHTNRILAQSKCPPVTKLLSISGGYVLYKSQDQETLFHIVHVPSKRLVHTM